MQSEARKLCALAFKPWYINIKGVLRKHLPHHYIITSLDCLTQDRLGPYKLWLLMLNSKFRLLFSSMFTPPPTFQRWITNIIILSQYNEHQVQIVKKLFRSFSKRLSGRLPSKHIASYCDMKGMKNCDIKSSQHKSPPTCDYILISWNPVLSFDIKLHSCSASCTVFSYSSPFLK